MKIKKDSTKSNWFEHFQTKDKLKYVFYNYYLYMYESNVGCGGK